MENCEKDKIDALNRLTGKDIHTVVMEQQMLSATSQVIWKGQPIKEIGNGRRSIYNSQLNESFG